MMLGYLIHDLADQTREILKPAGLDETGTEFRLLDAIKDANEALQETLQQAESDAWGRGYQQAKEERDGDTRERFREYIKDRTIDRLRDLADVIGLGNLWIPKL